MQEARIIFRANNDENWESSRRAKGPFEIKLPLLQNYFLCLIMGTHLVNIYTYLHTYFPQLCTIQYHSALHFHKVCKSVLPGCALEKAGNVWNYFNYKQVLPLFFCQKCIMDCYFYPHSLFSDS